MSDLSDPGTVWQWLDGLINYERYGPKVRDARTGDPAFRLGVMQRVLELSDDPQRLFPSIHVTGTNGKTSTARMTTRLLLSKGLRVGTYTSPHLQAVEERVSVNSEPIDRRDLTNELHSVRLLQEMLEADQTPTYFEAITAAAFRHFADAPVDVGVVEVGVGGRWDATNVIGAPVAVITNVGDDHRDYLGPTRADIARQKAGIVHEGATLVTAESDPEILAILRDTPAARSLVLGEDFEVVENRLAVGGRLIDIRTPLATYEEVFVSAHGRYQATNAATSVVATEAFFGEPASRDVVRDGLGTVTTPGRLEVVRRQPMCVIDGAHNAAAAEQLIASLDEEFSSTNERILVVGMLAPHEPEELLKALQVHRARLVIATTAPSPRAVAAAEIAESARELGAPVVCVESVADAYAEAVKAAGEESMVVITGSLYVAGAARTAAMADLA